MRTDITNINIPAPCHETWGNMTPSNNGRFCGSCAKTVVDFSGMTTDQIIGYLATSQNTCGRFGDQQMEQINRRLVVEQESNISFWKRLTVAITMFTSMQHLANAQESAEKVKTAQTQRSVVLGLPVIIKADTSKLMDVRGKVIDRAAKFGLPGATVCVNGKPTVATDTTGEFCVALPVSGGVISIRSLGYEENSVIVKSGQQEKTLEFALKETGTWMGEVTVYRIPWHKKMYYRFIKRPIKKILR